MRAKKSFSLKTVVLLLAVAAVFGGAVGGTLAWLSDTSEEIVNTFTAGDVDITLSETDSDGDKDPLKNNYKMVPGAKIAKDPKVTVLANSENCWLFVKIVETNNQATVTTGEGENATETKIPYLTYNLTTDWTLVPGQTNVYYYNGNNGIVETGSANQDFQILKGEGDEEYKNGFVTVNSAVTKTQLEGTANAKPTLTITAYAIQSDNLTKSDGTGVTTAADAWTLIGS